MKRFSGSQLAPDNKVYISGTSSSSYIHVIHNPNAAGAACEFEQGGLFLGAESRNWAGIPNHPYYGLGPWDGSPCDTLGIDHHPQAAFRHREQSGTVGFWDYSLFFPTQWAWDFGDGSAGSTEQNPVHTYAAPGEYVVCLTASNANASSTWCDTVRVEVVSSAGEVGQERADVHIFPNPTRNSFTVAYSLTQPAELTLYDVYGKVQLRRRLPAMAGREEIEVRHLHPGVYFVVISIEEGQLYTNRLLIAR
ncbi:MAG TPA: PKD domain-containing protein [Saprospiraceae bacterium]|nr:PKD domain-containing protein [Saprospiraceae bacterium]